MVYSNNTLMWLLYNTIFLLLQRYSTVGMLWITLILYIQYLRNVFIFNTNSD